MSRTDFPWPAFKANSFCHTLMSDFKVEMLQKTCYLADSREKKLAVLVIPKIGAPSIRESSHDEGDPGASSLAQCQRPEDFTPEQRIFSLELPFSAQKRRSKRFLRHIFQ
jgi:hypothetical protein